MNKLAITLIALMALCTTFTASAITPNELKEAKVAVRQWVRDYAIDSKLEGRNAKHRFLNLFADDSIAIAADYLPQPDYPFYDPQTTALEYAQIGLNKENIYQSFVEIDNLIIKQETLLNDTFWVEIGFTKTITFVSKDQTIVSSMRMYPPIDLHYAAKLYYSQNGKVAKAVSLQLVDLLRPFVVKEDESPETHSKYTVLTTMDEIEKSYRQPSSALILENYKATYDDPKYIVFQRDTLKNSVGVFGSYAFGDYSFKTAIDGHLDMSFPIIKHNQFAIGFNYYRSFFTRHDMRLGMDFGVAYQQSKSDIMGSYIEKFDNIDPDGDPYLHCVDMQRYHENVTHSAIAIPIGLRYDYFVSRSVAVFGRVGFDPTLILSSKSKAEGEGIHSGYYDWLLGITIDQNGIYDFGHFEVNDWQNKETTKTISLNARIDVGVSWYFVRQWSLDVSVGYNALLYRLPRTLQATYTTSKPTECTSIDAFSKNNLSNMLNLQIQINYNF